MTPAERQALLAQGVESQRQGRLAEAIAAFSRALEAFPADADALYLLGVARTRRGEFADALALLERAVERAPDAQPVQKAWRVAADALARRIVESEVCHAVLPRLRPLIDASPRQSSEGKMHCILATADIDARSHALADRVLTAIGTAADTMWRERTPPLRSGVPGFDDGETGESVIPRVDASRDEHPREGRLLFVGAARSPAAWWPRCRPSSVTLVIDEFRPCEIVDRVRELSFDGARQVTLCYAAAGVARRVALPGAIVGSEP